jgi:hypothetical protein
MAVTTGIGFNDVNHSGGSFIFYLGCFYRILSQLRGRKQFRQTFSGFPRRMPRRPLKREQLGSNL